MLYDFNPASSLSRFQRGKARRKSAKWLAVRRTEVAIDPDSFSPPHPNTHHTDTRARQSVQSSRSSPGVGRHSEGGWAPGGGRSSVAAAAFVLVSVAFLASVWGGQTTIKRVASGPRNSGKRNQYQQHPLVWARPTLTRARCAWLPLAQRQAARWTSSGPLGCGRRTRMSGEASRPGRGAGARRCGRWVAACHAQCRRSWCGRCRCARRPRGWRGGAAAVPIAATLHRSRLTGTARCQVPVPRRHDRKATLPVAEFFRRGRPLGLAKAPSSRERSWP